MHRESDLPPGVYEDLITSALEVRLRGLLETSAADIGDLAPPEAADRLSLHVASMVRRAVASLPETDRVRLGAQIARDLGMRLTEVAPRAHTELDVPSDGARVLRAVRALQPDGSPEVVAPPLIPLLDTALLTNAPGEPRVGSEVLSEIGSADQIDLIMAFIRRSGLNPLKDALQRHCQSGRLLRVLTSTYTNTTQLEALQDLADLGAQVRVSYDSSQTRLHAKAWIFHRRSGASTALIGSSNLTYSAQRTGMEWNLRVSGRRNPDVLDKVGGVFDAYWEGGDFLDFDPQQFADMTATGPGPTFFLSPVEIRLEPFQERLLEQIAVSRNLGHHRNLLVAATGTGKTVMSAVDYGRLRTGLPRSRLLFVAHREELLDQALLTFRQHLRDGSFGEKWVGGHRPRHFEHVFASVQSLSAAGLGNLDPKHFDVIIVDEFHHAAAASYRRLLEHLDPVELLGLTATPERSDGLSILHWFDDRIAAELRLWDAIDQNRLAPFTYYGVSDGTDLSHLPWRRGHGYDTAALSDLYTGDHAWARRVIAELLDRVDDPATFTALGFCVTVAHAEFMARCFRQAGIPAVHVSGHSPDEVRQGALRDLRRGVVRVVFSVDLFNEGVDVPTVDTLLLLRPTESPVLFLQQLGRGLRTAPGKTDCLVLDFVGQHRREFRFDRRFRALLGGTRQDLDRQVRDGFPYLPSGCHMQLDRVAQDVVLRSIRDAVPTRWRGRVEELRLLTAAGHEATLAAYLQHSGLDLGDVYAGGRCWSELREAAGLPVLPGGPEEPGLRRALGRMLHIDDPVRLAGYRRLVTDDPRSPSEQRLLRMLCVSLADSVLGRNATLSEAADLVRSHPQVLAELDELLAALDVDHVQHELSTHPDVPLRIHARYTRQEILAAFQGGDLAKTRPWREGTIYDPEQAVDLLAFTLDKTDGSFSPTTRYRDYAISRTLMHWESQSTTPADSDVGRRYRGLGKPSTQLLFARLNTSSRAFWFLGPGRYVSHEGERPMAITWQLDVPLPGDLFAQFAAAVA